MARSTYSFGNGRSEGNAGLKALLGARGAHKCEMANLGLPVAPGFCITPKCLQPAEGNRGSLSESARSSIKLAINELEDVSERRFGNLVDPLLLSVDGELRMPMQGFRGTIENLGLNDAIVQAWSAHTSPHFVWDSYRRLIFTFSRAVRRLDMEPFEKALSEVKSRLNAQCQLGREHADCHIPTHELRHLVATYKDLFEEQTGEAFPQAPDKQLMEAIHAASCSWDPENADCASAVTVQSTIFSNFDFRSAVGVTFTSKVLEEEQDADGSLMPEIRGKWMINAQSEDMARDRVPQEVTQEASCLWAELQGIGEAQRQDEFPSLEEAMPTLFAKLMRWQDIVENHFSDVYGLEFAIHQGRLWFHQTHTDEHTLREQFFTRHISDQSMMSLPMRETDEVLDESKPSLEEYGALPQQTSEVFAEPSDDGWVVEEIPLAWADNVECEAVPEPSVPSQPAEHAGDIQQASVLSILPYLSEQVTTRKPRAPLFSSPNAMMWRALQRLNRKRHERSLRRLSTHDREAEKLPSDDVSTKWATPCGLSLWQTALAGGAAAVACRGLGISIEQLEAAKHTRSTLGHSPGLVRAFCLQQGLRSFLSASCSPAGPFRAFPFGAICCTVYTNMCFATPADDSALCRLGCAASAVYSASVITHAGASRGKLWSPSLTALVPTMAIEMCTIDLVKNAAAERGHDVSPGVLVASGAVAGTVAQTIMHPLKAWCRQGDVAAIATSGAPGNVSTALRSVSTEGISTLFAGLGPACLRSMPIVAMNSFVRVGMVTHFLNLTSSTS